MAVYTHLSERALRQHLRPFQLGELIEARGVRGGAINTNYALCTTRGRYVLRILEDRARSESHFEESLLLYLADHGLPVPRMMNAGKHGRVISISSRQHLSVFQYLPGREVGVFEVSPEHAMQIGQFLAGMHLAVAGFRRRKRNHFDPPSVVRLLERSVVGIRRRDQVRDVRTLALELGRHEFERGLPEGIVHGDLFVDNARFSRGRLVGVLDFEMAASGPYVYDLAVAIVDWGFLKDRLVPERIGALVRGYESFRVLSKQERARLFELCCFAAARFATSRFYDFEVRQRSSAQRRYKDYRHFLARLLALRDFGARAFRASALKSAR